MTEAFPHTVIFADDLTGALEMGVLARRAGYRAAVRFGQSDNLSREPDVHTVVLDCGNRELPRNDAIAALRHVAISVRDSGNLALLKKTDSLLRGHIAAELAVLQALHPQRRMVYVPAYPLLGRRVRDARLFLTTDAGEIAVGDIVTMLDAAFAPDAITRIRGSEELQKALAAGGSSVLVCDGETQDAVDAMGSLLRAWLPQTIIAGPAGVFRAMFPPTGEAQPELPRIPCGVGFLGSVHPVSEAQWEALRATPRALLVDAAHTQFHDYLDAWGKARHAGRWLMLRARPASGLAPSMEFRPLPDALFLSGGSTAAACLCRLSCDELEPLRELEPGVVLSEACIDGRRVWVVTKSGAFGDAHTLARILAILQEGRPAP